MNTQANNSPAKVAYFTTVSNIIQIYIDFEMIFFNASREHH